MHGEICRWDHHDLETHCCSLIITGSKSWNPLQQHCDSIFIIRTASFKMMAYSHLKSRAWTVKTGFAIIVHIPKSEWVKKYIFFYLRPFSFWDRISPPITLLQSSFLFFPQIFVPIFPISNYINPVHLYILANCFHYFSSSHWRVIYRFQILNIDLTFSKFHAPVWVCVLLIISLALDPIF